MVSSCVHFNGLEKQGRLDFSESSQVSFHDKSVPSTNKAMTGTFNNGLLRSSFAIYVQQVVVEKM